MEFPILLIKTKKSNDQVQPTSGFYSTGRRRKQGTRNDDEDDDDDDVDFNSTPLHKKEYTCVCYKMRIAGMLRRLLRVTTRQGKLRHKI